MKSKETQTNVQAAIRKKILVVLSHPRENSLTHAIKDAVIRGLKKSNAEIKTQELYKEQFNPLFYDREENDKDKVTIQMKENVRWADGIVFVAPLWWASIPAMLKGYFDRIFTEDFSFKYNQAGMPEGLLENKKALLIGTCDTPRLFASLTGTTLGFKSVIKGILKFNGIKDSRFKLFGSVIKSTVKKRAKWIEKLERIGLEFAAPDRAMRVFKQKLSTFIKAVRLPLFSFVFGSVLLGAAIGVSTAGGVSWFGLALSFFIGFLAHTAASFSNEVADESTDRINLNRTIFNGGTGLLAKGLISKNELNMGWIISAGLALFIPIILVFLYQYHGLLIVGMAVVLLLGIGYSFPPFRFSRRGLGEIAALIAYGAPMMLLGFILQADKGVVDRVITGYRFYLISLPLALSVFVTLCLTQVPDTEADKKAGKKSISVIMGPKNVLIFSALVLLSCVFLFIGFIPMSILPLKYCLIASAFPLITGIFIFTHLDAYKIPAGMTMINIMGMSATSAVLSGVVPAVYFFSIPARLI